MSFSSSSSFPLATCSIFSIKKNILYLVKDTCTQEDIIRERKIICVLVVCLYACHIQKMLEILDEYVCVVFSYFLVYFKNSIEEMRPRVKNRWNDTLEYIYMQQLVPMFYVVYHHYRPMLDITTQAN